MDKKGECSKPTKVTIIETRHVVVEASDFKSMVQSLTGKEASVAWIGDSSYASSREEKKRKIRPQPPHKLTLRDGFIDTNMCGDDHGGMCDDVLDEMLQGLPLMEELEFWSKNL
ncbi:VQ motif-containing protein 1 [Bienertia sinuspersici]